jgi:micrococcal nuclease
VCRVAAEADAAGVADNHSVRDWTVGVLEYDPMHADAYQCTYLADWVSLKARWGLSMDESKYGRIRELLRDRSPDEVVAPWPETPPPATTTTTTTTITTTAPPPIEPAVPSIPTPSRNCEASYPAVCIPTNPPDLDCGDVPYEDFVVLQPDPHGFDGNQDGRGCEG